ncbi:MAG: DUF3823 domain-containing protein [Tannerella sp.]|jgi:hypothetical protein|nr:DUF3823 domain-containing protein [Tannerella sp.]
MRKQDIIKKTLLVSAVLCGLWLQGCSLDNYETPNAALTGRLVDSETNEPVPSQIPNGARIRIYEFYNDAWSSQPYNSWVKQDGSFENKSVFAGKYRITAEGPFAAIDPIETEISGAKTLDISVTPYLRLSISATSGAGGEINVSTKVSRSAAAPKIRTISFVASKTAYVDRNVFVKKVDIDVNGVDDAEVVSKTYSATLTGLTPGKTYWVRVGALANNSGSYYNYSQIVELTLP